MCAKEFERMSKCLQQNVRAMRCGIGSNVAMAAAGVTIMVLFVLPAEAMNPLVPSVDPHGNMCLTMQASSLPA